MDTTKKRQAALDLLAKTGMWRSNYAPPFFTILWRFDVDVPPPHFAPFWQNAMTMGFFFGLLWGAGMWFGLWSKLNKPVAEMMLAAAIAGVCFGVTMACYYAHGKRKYQLPSWKEFRV
ncbi:DUF6404 family protein [Undibacterium sp. TJN19]|uniref:DUF6404 family protein n=1 Tax=Undibacterium sp. TJN19 TaxID=3413055 RepID=UPI003BF112EA